MCPLFHPLRRTQPWVCIYRNTRSVLADAAWARFGQRNYWHEVTLWCLLNRFRNLVYPKPSKISALLPFPCNTACSNTLCGTRRRRTSSQTVVYHLFPCEFFLFNRSGLPHLLAQRWVHHPRNPLFRRCIIYASCFCLYQKQTSHSLARLRWI